MTTTWCAVSNTQSHTEKTSLFCFDAICSIVKLHCCYHSGFSVGGSSSAADLRGYARTSANTIFWQTPPNVWRTSGERSTDSARIRADLCGLRRELAELLAQKMPARKNFPKITLRRRRTSAVDVLPLRTAADTSAAEGRLPRKLN